MHTSTLFVVISVLYGTQAHALVIRSDEKKINDYNKGLVELLGDDQIWGDPWEGLLVPPGISARPQSNIIIILYYE